MNRTLLIGIIAIIAAGTILIGIKVISPQKAVPEQAIQEIAAAPALSVKKGAEVNSQKNQEAKNTGRQFTASQADPQDNKKEKDAPDMMSIIKEQMKDPAMRERMLKMTEIGIDSSYAQLFNDLGFDDERRRKFKEIKMEFTAKSMDFAFSGDTGASHAEEMSKMTSYLEADLKDLLGADYANYKKYEESMPSRRTVETLNQNLATNEKLDPAVQKNLVEALTEENKLYMAVNEHKYNGLSASTPTAELLDAAEKSMAELNKRYLGRAGSYLNEKQLKAFKDILDQQLSMMQMGRMFLQKK